MRREREPQRNGYQGLEAVNDQKACIRKRMLEKRAGMPEDYCRMADKRIGERVLAMEIYKQAQVIFTYVGTAKETDTRGIILAALAEGKTVAVPKCVGKGIMKAYRIRGTEDLVRGAYNIPEPGDGCGLVDPKDIGLAVVPCISCSEDGMRMGYGGGYYDRYLPGCGGLRAALCRERMLLRDMPVMDHDCRMDFVVTEDRVLEFGWFDLA